MHNARGDVEMILYLVAKGADPKAINREGKTTADMANGPVQRIQPWPEALALLEKLGAVKNIGACPAEADGTRAQRKQSSDWNHSYAIKTPVARSSFARLSY